MKETKYYCDMCGKEIERPTDARTQAKHIPIKKIDGEHGLKTATIAVVDTNSGGNYMDFCDDCKKFIASSFEFRKDVTKLKEEINKIWANTSTES